MNDPRPQRRAIGLHTGVLIGIYLVALVSLIVRALAVPLTVITEPYLALGAYLAVAVSCLAAMFVFSSRRGPSA